MGIVPLDAFTCRFVQIFVIPFCLHVPGGFVGQAKAGVIIGFCIPLIFACYTARLLGYKRVWVVGFLGGFGGYMENI